MRELVSWAEELAENMLAESLPRRWAHVQGVARRAQIAASLCDDADWGVLVAAALLHDVGYSPEIAHSGFHPLDGAGYLRDVGCPRRVCALVAHHSCAYREAELRDLSAELSEWEDERTQLRDALWWADMTTTPDGLRTTFDERLDEIQDRYGPRDVVPLFIWQAEPELRSAVERTEARLLASGISYE